MPAAPPPPTPAAPPATAPPPSAAADSPPVGRSTLRHRVTQFFRRTGPAGPFALIVTTLPAVGAVVLFSLAPTVIVPWLHAHGAVGVAVFIFGFAILGGFALAPTYANSIVGGWAFKFAIGFPAVMVGLAGAAAISYFLAQKVVGHRVEDVIHEHPRWEVVRDAVMGGSTLKTIGMIVLLRLSPFLPFETTNVVLAMCGVRPIPFVIGTMIGVMPRTAAIVFAASQAKRLDLHTTAGRWLLVIGIVMTVVCISLVAWIAKHALDRATRSGQVA